MSQSDEDALVLASDDDEPLETGESPTPTTTRCLPSLILEPAVFLVFFGRFLTEAAYQNQILYQTCVTVMQHNETECQPFLGRDRASDEVKKIETQVQAYAATIMMINAILESTIPAVVSLFLGPWSDKFGRRPILLSTFTGFLLSGSILIVLTQISAVTNINPWWFLLSSVPSVFSGGTCALITVLYCHVSDVATESARAMRMVSMEASLGLGMMAGSIAGGYIYAGVGAATLFILAGSVITVGLLYIIFLVPESLKPEDLQSESRIRGFFRFDLVKNLVMTCCKKRENYDRAIIWMVMMSLTMCIFAMEGEGTVNYMFVQKKFNWTVTDYSVFNTSRIVIQVVGSIIAMVLLRRFLKVSLITMTMLAFACCVLEGTVRATAQYGQEMYVALVLGMIRGVMSPMCKAILSQLTPSTEIGKIFSLTTSLQSLSPLGAAPLYAAVYAATAASYAGAFNFISVGLYFMCYCFSAIVFGMQKSMERSNAYRAFGS
ncbi:proton-coupled folate transporter [Drosophila guanche]|uniref:Blast:Proton-coupled folate transporter n=1 Tax=Drosophila guanche TaxID=7266 RepID=A0A3B0J0K8_DROGU|nr:proton-coupled folate transporter [Drosophila guanche]SPP74235.1 blast:Proton-coupled folate transporter [Drosophila guanche]